jgi:hypothetical protein
MNAIPSQTFHKLDHHVALADHGHFGRAAEACCIGQPNDMHVLVITGVTGIIVAKKYASVVREFKQTLSRPVQRMCAAARKVGAHGAFVRREQGVTDEQRVADQVADAVTRVPRRVDDATVEFSMTSQSPYIRKF